MVSEGCNWLPHLQQVTAVIGGIDIRLDRRCVALWFCRGAVAPETTFALRSHEKDNLVEAVCLHETKPVVVYSDPFWGARAFKFVEAVEHAGATTEVERLFRDSISEAGFSAFVMCGLPHPYTDFKNRIIANGWPAEWSQIYMAEDLAKNDPVERHCLRSIDPFDWSDAPYDQERDQAASDVMQRAADFGMKQGFCVPIHYGDGSGAAVSIAGEKPDFGFGVRPAMRLMALYAHHRVYTLIRPRPPKRDRVLTQREREVLRWALEGKTDWEIGAILNITERTARAHMWNAAQKLHAANRTATVVQALRCGEISL